MTQIVEGESYSVECPFVRDVYQEHEADGSFWQLVWKPGIEWGGCNPCDGDPEAIAHGVGKVIYHVVSVHKLPHPYPPRVFFTRRWVAPDGHAFGTSKLRIMTAGAFKARLRGYVPAGVDRWTNLRVAPLTKEEEQEMLTKAASK